MFAVSCSECQWRYVNDKSICVRENVYEFPSAFVAYEVAARKLEGLHDFRSCNNPNIHMHRRRPTRVRGRAVASCATLKLIFSA